MDSLSMASGHTLRSIRAAVAILWLIPVFASAVNASEVVVEYSFSQPVVQRVTIAGEEFDLVTMDSAPNSGEPGQPLLPASGARILIPIGAVVDNVEIDPGTRVSLGSDFKVAPASKPYPLSTPPTTVQPPVPDASIYGSAAPYPSSRFENIGAQDFRGYRIVTLKLHPVEYLPATGELYYYPQMKVVVSYTDGDGQTDMHRGLVADEQAAMQRVDNPERVRTYPAAARADGDYQLLILTTPGLVSSFQPLKTYHDNTGLLTEIHTTTDVGSTDPTAVRNYIRERYLNDGIEYVLIGGDDDLIPAVNLYVISWAGSDGSTVYDMPADLYFACLDGTYNYDGDSYWGEPSDGAGGGALDLTAEVSVGRAAVGTTAEATRFVNKTVTYLQTTNAYLGKALMCGEYLGFGGVSDYAGNMMDQIVNGSSADGYTTVGIPSGTYTMDYLYDRDWTGHDWLLSALTTRINNGVHIINHLGHGNTNYAMKMYSSQITSLLTNSNLCFLFSQACLAGHFDGQDCWAEYLTTKTNYGAFAAVMNAREGWGTENSTDGPSQRYNRQFWDAIFNTSENKGTIGRALQDAKEDNLYRINESCMRWCYYEMTLFGDPTVAFRGTQSLAFTYPEDPPRTIAPGESATFEVHVTGVNGGSVVSNSGQIHYRINGGQLHTSSMTQLSAGVFQTTLPALTCDEQMQYYVSAAEAYAGRIYNPTPSSPFSLVPTTGLVSVFNDNFQTDKGWVVSGDAADGHWERGVPQFSNRGDPPTDYDGSGQCFVTGNVAGNSDIDGGTTYLDSPVFDLTDKTAAEIQYTLWYSNDWGASPNEDVFVTYISNDGGETWVTAETVGPSEEVSGGWISHAFQVTDFVTPTANMKVRFEASDLNDASVVEAAVDAFKVVTYDCIPDGDDDGDGIMNSVDNCLAHHNPLQEDTDGDHAGDSCDVCPADSLNDVDNDGYCANLDNCPSAYNPDQIDADNDTYGSACDCNDGNAAINPNTLWYVDADHDGFGSPAVTKRQCAQPTGYVLDNTDCNDGDFTRNPNTPWYADTDGDGHGVPGVVIRQCTQPTGYVADSTDNCPNKSNPDQADSDSDGIGDACEAGCCVGESTGNVDNSADNLVTMGDLTVMIDHLFITLNPVICPDEANVDLSPDGLITMGDLTVLIDHLFITLEPLPACP